MSLDYKSIGMRIKKYRLMRGKSQEQLAEMAGLSRSHISYIENGIKAVSLESLVEISNALEVSADEFLVDNMDFPKSLNDNDASYILLDCTPQELAGLLSLLQPRPKQALPSSDHHPDEPPAPAEPVQEQKPEPAPQAPEPAPAAP